MPQVSEIIVIFARMGEDTTFFDQFETALHAQYHRINPFG